MTAFNNIQPDTEAYNDGEACPNEEQDISSSPKALAPAVEGKQSSGCCRNKEGCGDCNDLKLKSSEPTFFCCRCMLDCEKLSAALMCNQELLSTLNHELEQERIAAESAAKEAVSMILRLQVEKAALQMEARHYQQVLEAKTLYDEETIAQLKDIISSQEADRMALEKEVIEYREILCKYSETVFEEGRLLDCTDDLGSEEKFLISPGVSCQNKTVVGRVLGLGSSESIRPMSLETTFNHIKVEQVEAAHHVGSSLECKDDAKTKYVVSISPILDNSGGASVSNGLAATKKQHDCWTWSKEFGCFKVGDLTGKGSHLDSVVKECWSSILKELSNLQRQIWKSRVLELPGCDEDLLDLESGLELMFQLADSGQEGQVSLSNRMISVVEAEGLSSPFKKFVGESGGTAKAHSQVYSWGDTIAVTDICVAALGEKFGACKHRLRSLEAARKAITEAITRMKGNKETPDFLLVIAADIIKEFVSFTSLGCDVLNLLQNLIRHLTKLVEVGDNPGRDSSSGFEAMVKPDDLSPDYDEKLRESSMQGESPSTQEADSKLGKLALLWSSSLEWLSDERCRAETAFSGWDH